MILNYCCKNTTYGKKDLCKILKYFKKNPKMLIIMRLLLIINTIKGVINMNNFKKIGLSALAGSLVAVSAQAADVSLSGGASVAFTSNDWYDKTGYYMNDSVTMTVSGETDGGLTITTSLELDGAATSGSSFDNRSIKIGNDEMGTITFSGHGGDSVIGGWDGITYGDMTLHL